MGRLLDELSPAFRPQAVELLARLAEAQIAVLIVCTGRSQAEQDALFARGASKVRHSRHQDGEAMDLAIYRVYRSVGPEEIDWSPFQRDVNGQTRRNARGAQLLTPSWLKLVQIVTGMGLRSGASFGETYPGAWDGWDTGHVEVPRIGKRGADGDG